MMTSSNGHIFRVTGPLCGEVTGPGEFPAQRPVTQSFDVFFDLRLNKRLSKQSWGWWFEAASHPLLRQCNACTIFQQQQIFLKCNVDEQNTHRTQGMIIATTLLRQNEVANNNDVIITSCAHWVCFPWDFVAIMTISTINLDVRLISITKIHAMISISGSR